MLLFISNIKNTISNSEYLIFGPDLKLYKKIKNVSDIV